MLHCLDALRIQLGVYSPQIQWAYDNGLQKELPKHLDGEASKSFHKTEIKHRRSGVAWLGKNTKGHTYLLTNGALLFRRQHGLPDPPVKTKLDKRLANQLSLEELQLFEHVRNGEEPWRYSMKWLTSQLQACYQELEEKLQACFQNWVPPHEILISPRPVVLYLAEFYNEHPLSPGRLVETIDEFTKAIAPSLGAFSCQNNYSDKEELEEGILRKWEIPVRSTASYKKRYNEYAVFKGYSKGDKFRGEVAYHNPKTQKIEVWNLAALEREIEVLAADAIPRLEKVAAQLTTRSPRASAVGLAAALKHYGIQSISNKHSIQNFLHQLVEVGVFDPVIEKKKFPEMDPRTLRDKIAHPTWGIVSRVWKEGRHGPGKQSLLILHDDWEARYPKYPAGVKTPLV